MSSLGYLNKFLVKYKKRLLLGVFFIIVSNFFAIYPAIIIRDSINSMIDTLKIISSENLDIENVKALIFNLFLILLAVAFLRGLFVFAMRQTIIITSRYIEYDLKNDLFKKFLSLDLSFFKNSMTGDLISRISEDINKVRMYLGPVLMYSVNIISLLSIIIYNMFNVSIYYSLVTLAPMPILAISIYIITNVMSKKNEIVQNQLAKLSAVSQETFSGIKTIKSFNIENFSISNFKNEIIRYRKFNINLILINSLFFPFILFLIGLSSLITVFIGIKEYQAGLITPGVIAEFLIYINMITWPVASIGWIMSLAQRAASAQKRYNETMNTKSNIVNIKPIEPILNKNSIEFINVYFSYPDKNNSFELNNINFDIKAGQKIAFLGKTGSGKSTIINLLLRLYDTDKGKIIINGIELKKLELKALYNKIGYVPQDSFLFSDTIKNNIKMGSNNTNISDNQIITASKKADIYNNIKEFSEQFETKIGERGVTLSGGQKQRTSIARAIVDNKDILIFDDCLSAVDSKTEKVILDNIVEKNNSKITILVSNKVSSVKNFDKIFVLEDGKIIESGVHEELLKNKKLYYKYYKRQKETK